MENTEPLLSQTDNKEPPYSTKTIISKKKKCCLIGLLIISYSMIFSVGFYTGYKYRK